MALEISSTTTNSSLNIRDLLAVQASTSPKDIVTARVEQAFRGAIDALSSALQEFQRDRYEDAMTSLKKAQSLVPNSRDFIECLLTIDPSLENIARAMSIADSLEDKKGIYRRVIAMAPNTFEAYEALAPLLTDWEERTDLMREGLERAVEQREDEWVCYFRAEAEKKPPVLEFMTVKCWKKPSDFLHRLPPQPQALKDFLAGPCPFWEGVTAGETHIVVPLFGNITQADGTVVPRTLDSLSALDEAAEGTGFRYIDKIPGDICAEGGFRWAVLTKDLLPGSRTNDFGSEVALPPGYETPDVLTAATAILWYHRQSGEQCFSVAPSLFMRCWEDVGEEQVLLGNFGPTGLCIGSNYDNDNRSNIGFAGLRKF